jgi:hypothetical protein
MTDTENTLSGLNEIFQELLILILGYVGTGSPVIYPKAAYKAVRVSWPTSGAPGWDVTDNVLFLKVFEDDDPINLQKDVQLTETGSPAILNEAVGYTRVIRLALIAYGPNSWSNIQLIRRKLFKQVYREYLAVYNLFMIPDIATPTRFPELFSGKWYERIDTSIRFNEKVINNETIPYIESVDVTVEDVLRRTEITIEA